MKTGSQPRLEYFNFIGTLLLVTVIILLSGITARAESPSETAKSSILSASEIDYLPFCVVDQENRASGFSVELICAAFDIETVLGETDNNKGTFYENSAVDTCLTLFRGKGYQLP